MTEAKTDLQSRPKAKRPSPPSAKSGISPAASAQRGPAKRSSRSGYDAANEPLHISGLLATFNRGNHFIVTSHSSPDGDALGSALAFAELLEQLGKKVDVVFADPVPHIYRSLPGVARVRRGRSLAAFAASAPVIILECDSIERTGLTGFDGRQILNIDHHRSGRPYGTVNWIDETSCAVAAMVYRLAVAAKVAITPTMATCLYTAVLSDTAGFTVPSTDAETFALAHALTLKGARPGDIARNVYYSNPLSKTRLLGAALSNLNFADSVAWSWVTLQQLEQTGADAEDCEGVINHLIGIDGAQAAVFLRELSTGDVRLSIRSKGKVDVATVAEALGGGGHKNASGCTLAGPLAAAVERILQHLRAQI